jgi:hypothetical protein
VTNSKCAFTVQIKEKTKMSKKSDNIILLNVLM